MRPHERTERYRRNPELEALLERLNGLLAPAHESTTAGFIRPERPVVFIVGGPRSGTTLVMQWLAATGAFGYPSNLVARFFRTPYIGALIHEMVLNPRYAYRNDFIDVRPFDADSEFSSDLGKTVGLAAPNVFWYFWRRFFDFGECPHLDANARKRADDAGFVRDLAALEAAFERPFALKGLIANWDVDYIDSLFDRALFIHVRRSAPAQMASILSARTRFRGDRRLWWGFRPPEKDVLSRAATPEAEVAVQIHSTRRAIERAFATMHPARWLDIDYESFCEAPESAYALVRDRFTKQDALLPQEYRGPRRFSNNNTNYAAEYESLRTTFATVGRDLFDAPRGDRRTDAE